MLRVLEICKENFDQIYSRTQSQFIMENGNLLRVYIFANVYNRHWHLGKNISAFQIEPSVYIYHPFNDLTSQLLIFFNCNKIEFNSALASLTKWPYGHILDLVMKQRYFFSIHFLIIYLLTSLIIFLLNYWGDIS